MLQSKPVDSQTAAVMHLVLQEERYYTTLVEVTLKIDLLKLQYVLWHVMEVLPLEPEECSTQQVRQPRALQSRVPAPSDFTVCYSTKVLTLSALDCTGIIA